MTLDRPPLNRWRIFGPLLAAALLAVGAWPMSYLASPRWEVWVLNDVGQPIPQISVRLVYQNYSAEGKSHEVTLRADENGHVLFPPNYEKASIFQHVLYTMSAAMAGVHASFGRHAHVLAFGAGYEGFADADWQGNPDSMQSRIGGHPPVFEQPVKP